MLKVHISLDPDMAEMPAARARIRQQIAQITPLLNVNEGRLERRGILTAEIQTAESIPLIAALPGVAAVEPDEERQAL